jgi:hypothetical protein
MTRRRLFLFLSTLAFAGASVGAAGCASGETSATTASELRSSPEYDAVIAAPDQLVSGPNAPTAQWPTFRRATGFYGKAQDDVSEKLLAFAEWPQVKVDDKPVFSSVRVTQDLTEEGVRKVAVTIVVNAHGQPRVDVLVTIGKNDEGDTVVHAENPTPVFIRLGERDTLVVHPGQFQIDAVIGAYGSGTIVDASIKARTISGFVDMLADGALRPILPALIRWSRSALDAPR